MMPMLRVCSFNREFDTKTPLPTIMGKGFIRLCHFVGILSLFNRSPSIVCCVDQLSCKLFFHRFLGTLFCKADDPSDPSSLSLPTRMLAVSPTSFLLESLLSCESGCPPLPPLVPPPQRKIAWGIRWI